MTTNKFSYKMKKPVVNSTAFIAHGAVIAGDVHIGSQSSVWFNTVIRGDQNSIRIGSRTNIQDNCTLHVDDKNKCVIGDGVSVGHGAIVHACTVEDSCLIGMGSIILSGARVGKYSIIGAGAVVTEGARIPQKSLVLGVPGRVVRKLSPKDIDHIKKNAEKYLSLMKGYKN